MSDVLPREQHAWAASQLAHARTRDDVRAVFAIAAPAPAANGAAESPAQGYALPHPAQVGQQTAPVPTTAAPEMPEMAEPATPTAPTAPTADPLDRLAEALATRLERSNEAALRELRTRVLEAVG